MSIIATRLTSKDGKQQLNRRPLSHEAVTVKKCGNITEIIYSEKCSYGGTTKKLSKDEYLDTRTGEVKLFNHNDKRINDTKSIKRSLKQGRDMINANVSDPKNCKWITLTYAENMQDVKKLYNDFKNFKKTLSNKFPFDKYITCSEPQGRGAWHIHLLLIFQDKAPFMPNEEIRALWKHGFVTVKNVDDVDNIGAYLSAYLSDMPLSDIETLNITANCTNTKEAIYFDENGNKVSKKVVKGFRLSMYPPSFHIFRWSRNCTKPTVSRCNADTAEKMVKGQSLVYETTKQIIDTSSGFTNVINIRSYNKFRKVKED